MYSQAMKFKPYLWKHTFPLNLLKVVRTQIHHLNRRFLLLYTKLLLFVTFSTRNISTNELIFSLESLVNEIYASIIIDAISKFYVSSLARKREYKILVLKSLINARVSFNHSPPPPPFLQQTGYLFSRKKFSVNFITGRKSSGPTVY